MSNFPKFHKKVLPLIKRIADFPRISMKQKTKISSFLFHCDKNLIVQNSIKRRVVLVPDLVRQYESQFKEIWQKCHA